jgi:GPI ethanolamine phosphate transferase 1
MVLVGLLYLAFEETILADFSSVAKSKLPRSHITRGLVGVQIGLVALSMLVTRSSSLALQAKLGLPRGNQVVGWLVLRKFRFSSNLGVHADPQLVVSLAMPLAYRLEPNNHYLHRLMVVFLTFAPTFVILTISYEGLFYVVFCATLVAWVRLEHQVFVFSSRTTTRSEMNSNGSAKKTIIPALRPLALADARVALFFLILLQSAFFSTGNIASVSAFSLESVSRLMPIFDPFSQGALLVLKLMIPFALISANLGILNVKLGVAPSALLMVVMAITDILTLYFFWVVRDEGSWLEIGSTISHFVIASLLCVFVAGLEAVSAMFISGVEVDSHHDGGNPSSNGKTGGVSVNETSGSTR